MQATDQYKDSAIPLVSNLNDDYIPVDSSNKFDPFVRWSRIGNSLEGEFTSQLRTQWFTNSK
jgi:hypothetical protein